MDQAITLQAIRKPLGLAGTMAVAKKMAEMARAQTAPNRRVRMSETVIFNLHLMVPVGPPAGQTLHCRSRANLRKRLKTAIFG